MDLLSWPFTRFGVVLDGEDVADIWPRQIKVLQVSAGNHRLRLDFYRSLKRSEEIDVSLATGERKDFVCFVNAITYAAIRPASEKDVTDMERWQPPLATPRNLADDGPE